MWCIMGNVAGAYEQGVGGGGGCAYELFNHLYVFK